MKVDNGGEGGKVDKMHSFLPGAWCEHDYDTKSFHKTGIATR